MSDHNMIVIDASGNVFCGVVTFGDGFTITELPDEWNGASLVSDGSGPATMPLGEMWILDDGFTFTNLGDGHGLMEGAGLPAPSTWPPTTTEAATTEAATTEAATTEAATTEPATTEAATTEAATTAPATTVAATTEPATTEAATTAPATTEPVTTEPANDCNSCDPPLPDSFTFTGTGFADDLVWANSTYTLTWIASCTWRKIISATKNITLYWVGAPVNQWFVDVSSAVDCDYFWAGPSDPCAPIDSYADDGCIDDECEDPDTCTDSAAATVEISA